MQKQRVVRPENGRLSHCHEPQWTYNQCHTLILDNKLMDEPQVISQEFILQNAIGLPLRVVVEPLGEPYMLEPSQAYRIVVSGLKPGTPTIKWVDEKIVEVYAWPGAVVTVFQGDEELSPKRDIQKGF